MVDLDRVVRGFGDVTLARSRQRRTHPVRLVASNWESWRSDADGGLVHVDQPAEACCVARELMVRD
jgi:hypothetical protein